MNLPYQSQPVIRSRSIFSKRQVDPGTAIHPSSFFCTPCKWGVGKFGSTLIGMGCAEAVGAFEVACNAAFDVESGGLAAIPCTAAATALGFACRAGSGSITQGMIDSVAAKACGWAC